MAHQLPSLFGDKGAARQLSIVVTDAGSQKPFMVVAVQGVFDYHLVGAAAAAVAFPEAWQYRLGNYSALEWVLDQYKESTPKDPTIREKFNTYRFADYKEKVIDLLARVTTVSVETQRIVEEMKKAPR